MSRTDNAIKIAYAIKVCIAYLIVAVLAGRVTSNFQIAFGITCAFQFWSLLWIKILVQSKNIYSVKVMTELLPDWIPVSLPADKDTLKIRKDKVVTSISELSGIRGGHMMVALRVMSSITCVLTFMAIQDDLHHRNTNFFRIKSSEDMVPICLYIAAMGKFMTGHFELNLMDGVHCSTGHRYTGVMGISLGTTWGWILSEMELAFHHSSHNLPTLVSSHHLVYLLCCVPKEIRRYSRCHQDQQ